MEIEYKFAKKYYKTHENFNNECDIKTLDLNNFKSKGKMLTIVQNCPYGDGLKHLKYITDNYPLIINEDNLNRWRKYDKVGSQGNHKLIYGISPKVFSYIKEILLFYTYFLKPKNIEKLDNILVIGGGYGMEIVLLYDILNLVNVKVNKIYGVDMKNVSELQNYFFKYLNMENICKSYDDTLELDKIDCIYSNCCLAEVPPEINFKYYNNYFLKTENAYIVWTHLFSEIPKYYREYTSNILEPYNLCKDCSTLILK